MTGSAPSARGANTTVLASLSLQGINSIMTIEGSTDTAVFSAYVENFLLPTIRKGDVVVLDNYGPHKSPKIEALIRSKGARALFLPPYHPEYNPIENAWSKMKSILRALEARARKDLDKAIAKAAKQISTQDILGWYQHCGYTVK